MSTVVNPADIRNMALVAHIGSTYSLPFSQLMAFLVQTQEKRR